MDRAALRDRGPLLALLALVAACGGNTPAGPSSEPFGDPAPAVVSDTPTAAVDPLDLLFGLPVGTQPGFTGSPYDARSFPHDEIVTVLGRDAIPAITDPAMARLDEVGYLADSDIVLGVVVDGDARAYPHNIGWWHEIVNDVVGGVPVSVTFCPLTGTGLVFDGRDAGGRVTLGVSGLLYNTNLVMYNRRDGESLYPQIYGAGVDGPDNGQALRLLPVVETTWAAWKRLYPDTRVLIDAPYPSSQYTVYPYQQYRTDHDWLLFPVRPQPGSNPNPFASALGAKERVLGVRVDGSSMAFPFAVMGPQRVVNEVVGGLEIVVAYDGAARLAIPFSRRLGDRVLHFDLVEDGRFPFSLRDRETQSLWDIRGLAVAGELAGQRLTQLPAHNAMWFAWVTFWPRTDVWLP